MNCVPVLNFLSLLIPLKLARKSIKYQRHCSRNVTAYEFQLFFCMKIELMLLTQLVPIKICRFCEGSLELILSLNVIEVFVSVSNISGKNSELIFCVLCS